MSNGRRHRRRVRVIKHPRREPRVDVLTRLVAAYRTESPVWVITAVRICRGVVTHLDVDEVIVTDADRGEQRVVIDHIREIRAVMEGSRADV